MPDEDKKRAAHRALVDRVLNGEVPAQAGLPVAAGPGAQVPRRRQAALFSGGTDRTEEPTWRSWTPAVICEKP